MYVQIRDVTTQKIYIVAQSRLVQLYPDPIGYLEIVFSSGE
jgi:hypothetical protein